MNTLRDLTAGIMFGAAMYGTFHAEMPTAEDAQQYNTAIEQCADYLGGAGQYVTTVPAPCEPFASDSQSVDGKLHFDANGRLATYYLPSQDELRSDFPPITPAEEASIEANAQRSAEIEGALFGAVLFGALRFFPLMIRERKGVKRTPRPVTAPRGPVRMHPNEDSKEWPWAFPGAF